MEKSTPHCKLSVIKDLIAAGNVLATGTAIKGAAALNMDANAMLSVVQSLTTRDFYKSMTTYNDHTVWQDVYRPKTAKGVVYVKLTVEDGVLIVSFKRSTS